MEWRTWNFNILTNLLRRLIVPVGVNKNIVILWRKWSGIGNIKMEKEMKQFMKFKYDF